MYTYFKELQGIIISIYASKLLYIYIYTISDLYIDLIKGTLSGGLIESPGSDSEAAILGIQEHKKIRARNSGQAPT